MSLWVIFMFFGIYFTLAFSITRIRAEFGPPVHEFYTGGPAQIMTATFGARRIGAHNLTMFAFLWGFNRAYRSHPMPHQLEGFKLAQQAGMRSRNLVFAILLAGVLGLLASGWSILHMHYNTGTDGFFFGEEPFRKLEWRLFYMPRPDYQEVSFMGVGLLFTLFLAAMRMRFIWWPFHPIGYVFIRSYVRGTSGWVWFPIFISWVCKTAIFRHGGIRSYRKAVPFFAGLILGGYIIGGLWKVITFIFGIHTYSFWH